MTTVQQAPLGKVAGEILATAEAFASDPISIQYGIYGDVPVDLILADSGWTRDSFIAALDARVDAKWLHNSGIVYLVSEDVQ